MDAHVKHATTGLPARREYLFKGGYVVSVDPGIGNLPRADVHTRAGAIVAVGPDIVAPAAEVIDATNTIVIPGFVETHWHLWTSLYRNLIQKDFEYFAVKNEFVPLMTADDFYRADMLALTEAVHAGITTVHNFAHNIRSPAHADAEMRAHADSGVRALYSYGYPDGMSRDATMPTDDVPRLQRGWLGANSPLEGRLTMGLCMRGPGASSWEIFGEEVKRARDLGLPVAVHAGQSVRSYLSAAEMEKRGLIDRNTLMVHYLLATDQDREIMARTGASFSISMHSELRLGRDGGAREQLLHMREAGVNASFSLDANSLAPVTMFEAMSLAWYMGIPWNKTPGEKLPPLDFAYVIEMATMGGARALGLADRVGSLTPGKRADVLMIRADDLNMIPFGDVEGTIVRSATVANIDTVMIDGRILKRNRQIVGLDVEKVKREAIEATSEIRRRAGGRLKPAGDRPPAF